MKIEIASGHRRADVPRALDVDVEDDVLAGRQARQDLRLRGAVEVPVDLVVLEELAVPRHPLELGRRARSGTRARPARRPASAGSCATPRSAEARLPEGSRAGAG